MDETKLLSELFLLACYAIVGDIDTTSFNDRWLTTVEKFKQKEFHNVKN